MSSDNLMNRMGNEMATMLRKVGFFHYGGYDQSDPPGSLRDSLAEASQEDDVSDSLIVAPEAFNIRNGYWSHSRSRDQFIKESLVQISVDFRIALVVGLVEEGAVGEPGYSSAYLIDGRVCQLLSLKERKDGSGNYRPYEGGWDKPVLHRGICIGALICADAANFNSPASERHEAVLEQVGAFKVPQAVLCVPACMREYESKEVARAWPTQFAVVVGNSWFWQPSLVLRAGERRDADFVCFKGPQNNVRVIALG
ncbi:MAG: hypothetical protein AAB225_03055 [Acidobacteriota bacterium]